MENKESDIIGYDFEDVKRLVRIMERIKKIK
jgi:hypothetical protein